MNYETILKEIRALSVEEQKALIEAIQLTLPDETTRKKRSILELRGLGAELWKDIDVQAYLDEMRDEWDAPR